MTTEACALMCVFKSMKYKLQSLVLITVTDYRMTDSATLKPSGDII